jgi:hypothetical protein
MTRLTQAKAFENELSSTADAFLRAFGVSSILKQVGAYKKKGVPVIRLFQELFALAFRHRTMFQILSSSNSAETGKDAFYRFVKSCRVNWMRFTTLLAAAVVKDVIEPLTDKTRVNVFIVDDTPYERSRSKKVELLSRVYDHCKKTYIKGFRLLTLGFSDGNTFVPVNSCLLASADPKNRFSEARAIDRRTCGYRQRQLAQSTAPFAMMKMIGQALDSGIRASHVLFDSWFAYPCNILALKDKKLDVIARVKKTEKIHYEYGGVMMPLTEIYRMNRKRRGRSRYLLSVDIKVCGSGRAKSVPAKLVYVRNKNNRKDYVVLLSTDVSVSEDEIVRIYGKRWDIEVFFKVCKSFLRLTRECASRSYDAMTAYAAIVFARYAMLAVENRIGRDGRTFGKLFYAACDELSDITLAESLILLMKAFCDAVAEKLFLAEEELDSLMECFMSKLPQSLRDKLLQWA